MKGLINVINILFRLVLASLLFLSANLLRAQEAPVLCNPPSGIGNLWAKEDIRFIFIGDVHGTNEAPTLFAEIVCDAAAKGKHILVALEHLETDTVIFQNYLKSAGTEIEKQKFLLNSSWSQQSDGRTSEAMWVLIEKLRKYKSLGLQIDIVSFIRPAAGNSESQEPYERSLATSLLESSNAINPDLVLVLVGSIHASKLLFQADGIIPFKPMAMHLPKASTLSLILLHEGGEAWNCRGRNDCGVHTARPRLSSRVGDELELGIKFGPDLREGFEGVIMMGQISASLPYKTEASQ